VGTPARSNQRTAASAPAMIWRVPLAASRCAGSSVLPGGSLTALAVPAWKPPDVACRTAAWMLCSPVRGWPYLTTAPPETACDPLRFVAAHMGLGRAEVIACSRRALNPFSII
jgi:hypothetical protein